MKKHCLGLAVLGALALAQVAVAQEYDDRWYFAGGATAWDLDSDRNTQNYVGPYFGFGRNISPNVSLDAEFDYLNPQKDGSDLLFSTYSISLDARYRLGASGDRLRPYFLGGLGWSRHEEEFELIDNPDSPGQIKGNNVVFNLGVGVQADYDKWSIRGEVRTRFDNNDESASAPNSDFFNDWGFRLGFIYHFGDKAQPAPAQEEAVAPPPPPAPTCDQLDDDGDGVNNCEDKCPNSQAGQAIGPDGCPVALTIDLRGVNFDFDKATLRPESTAILDEAVEVLTKYPQLKVEVAGHTDSVGADAYNQALSERRAKAAYDYLLAHGVSADQLTGPNGYGESRPIDSNDTRDGRARNRRTELNVQN